IGELQQRFREIRFGAKRLLKHLLGARMVPLVFFNVAHIEQARGVVRVFPEAGLKIFARLVESPEMPVRQSHKRVRRRGRIHVNERFELFDSLLSLASHEITLAKRSAKIRTLWRDLQTGFKQGDSVLKIILRHTDTRKQEDDVGIFRRQLVSAHQQRKRVYRLLLVRINLCQQIKRRSEEHTSELQ